MHRYIHINSFIFISVSSKILHFKLSTVIIFERKLSFFTLFFGWPNNQNDIKVTNKRKKINFMCTGILKV